MTSQRRPEVSRRALLAAVPAVALGACAAPTAAPAAPAPAQPPTTTAPPATTSPAASSTDPATEVVRASSGRQEVALTFHGAGDLELARKILTEFAQRGAAVTVLAIGTWLQQYPDVVKIATDNGHELGNHTWSHKTLTGLSDAVVRSEVERCRDKLAELTGNPGDFFRQSAAQHATTQILRLAGAAGYRTVLSYDIDSLDFTDPGAAAIRRNVAKATAGSVVSMHLGHPGTLEALPGLLDDLDTRGLKPVTAGALFA